MKLLSRRCRSGASWLATHESEPGSVLSSAWKDLSGFLRFVALGGVLVAASFAFYWASSRATDFICGSGELSEVRAISAKAVQALFFSSLLLLAEVGLGCLRRGVALLVAAWVSTFAYAFVFIRLELSPSRAPTLFMLQIAALLVASGISRRYRPWKLFWPVEEPEEDAS